MEGGWRERSPPLPLPASAAVKAADTSWLPLPSHPVFARRHRPLHPSLATGLLRKSGGSSSGADGDGNLAAWDPTSSRLYLWDSDARCVHRLSFRFGDPDDDGTPAIEAASPSEVLLTDIHMGSTVHHISLNGQGSALLLVGSDVLCVVYVYDRVSTNDDSIICRTVSVASEMYFGQNNGLRIVKVSWHPYSRTHIGILSSDTVLRLYDLSSDLKRPEQEYYLQPIEPGGHGNMAPICPVAFSFGGEHLWDRFTVFILFNDGSIYILCPVVPFRSIFSWPCLEEIYEDANVFGLKSSDTKAVSNSWFAVSWLEATFPELTNKLVKRDNMSGLRAHPYAPMDASLSLQGPLHKVSHAMTVGKPNLGVDCKGRSVGFLYNSIGKDSVLVIAWSSGQLQIDALAEEVQPMWSVGASPRLRVDSHGRIIGIAMICESISQESSTGKLTLPPLNQGISDPIWLGNPPPLLGLAIVDLALPNTALNNPSIFVCPDPVVPERIYCQHGGGVDVIILHFLPFSNLNSGTDESSKAPSVYPILGGFDEGTFSQSLLCGFIAMADSLGNSRVIGITSSYDCIMLEVKRWNERPLLPVDIMTSSDLSNSRNGRIPDIINKEVLAGPKLVLIPYSSALRSLSAESIDGRSALHHYIKLFHEHYVEYAHKVYFELKEHGNHIKGILDEQHTRLRDANQMLSKFEGRQSALGGRVNNAIQAYLLLEQRLQRFRTLPGTRKKPLSKAEHEFKAQLERLAGLELDALHSSVEALNARMRRYTESSAGTSLATSRQIQGRSQVPDVHFMQLKSSIEKLSLVNNENTKKVKAIEHALKDQDRDV